MLNVKISVPTYKANSWGRLDQKGEVEISSEVNSLSEEYPRIKAQVDELLEKANAENRLILDLESLETALEKKQNTLDDLQDKIEQARHQLRLLENFLKRLGIDPRAYTYTLNISDDLALKTATNEDSDNVAVEVEVDPIPFDSLGGDNNAHEF
jgi:chromosome segregation ATPase